jgi:predicted nucleic acid-binding protein
LGRVLGLPRVVVEDPPAVRRATLWYARGLDFADAMHVASSRAAKRFATFDKALIERARALDAPPPVAEP